MRGLFEFVSDILHYHNRIDRDVRELLGSIWFHDVCCCFLSGPYLSDAYVLFLQAAHRTVEGPALAIRRETNFLAMGHDLSN